MSYQIYSEQIVSARGRTIRDEFMQRSDYYAVIESANDESGGYVELRLAAWSDADPPSAFVKVPRDDGEVDMEFAGQVEIDVDDFVAAAEELRALKRGEHPSQQPTESPHA